MAVAAAALGVAAAFFFPAYSAILPRILPAEQLLAANGVEGVVRPVFQRAVGPAVAGIVVGATFPALGAVAWRCCSPSAWCCWWRPGRRRKRRRRDRSRAAARAARSARRLRLHAAHPVAAVDAAVREHVRAGGARPDRGAAAVHRQGPVRRRRADVRLHPGVLRDGQCAGRAGGVVAAAAASLPVGDDGDVGPRLRSAGGRRRDVVVPVDGRRRRSSSASPTARAWSSGARCCSGGCRPEMLGRVSSLDFFVSLAFMPVSFAIVGPLSKVVSMETIFLVAGVAPVLFAAVAMCAARMRRTSWRTRCARRRTDWRKCEHHDQPPHHVGEDRCEHSAGGPALERAHRAEDQRGERQHRVAGGDRDRDDVDDRRNDRRDGAFPAPCTARRGRTAPRRCR